MILHALQSLYNSGSVIYVFIPARSAGNKFELLLKKKKEVPLRFAPLSSHVTKRNHFHPYFWTPLPLVHILPRPFVLVWSSFHF